MCDPVSVLLGIGGGKAVKKALAPPPMPPLPQLPAPAQMPKAAVMHAYRRRNAAGGGMNASASSTQLTGPLGVSPLAGNIGRSKALGE